jgi:pimeloyl-ACP methyl ester carboxylesterase
MPALSRDGISLAYEETGSGQPPFLWVHGWSCDHTYFAPQVEHFSRRHRCVSVDLRGHGISDAPQQDYTLEAFADDLAWLCGELRLEKPVVVGHSMGGSIALTLAGRYPDLPGAIIMVDMRAAGVLGPPPESDPRWSMLEGIRGPSYREAARGFVEQMFLPSSDPGLKARIIEQMTSTPQHVIASAMDSVTSADLASAAQTCKVPALYIQGGRPQPGLDRFEELCPQLVLGRTVGAGHFNQLEVPDQVNAMIERFLETSGLNQP